MNAGQSGLPTSRPVAVSLKNLRKSFGPLEVLKGISLDAREGDVVSIIGSSGSGKSTLLRCINLLETPNSGEIVVAGETVRLTPGRQRRDAAARAGPNRAAALAHRYGVPELQSVGAQDDPRKCHRGADPRPEETARRVRCRGRDAARQKSASPRSATTILRISRAASSSAPRSPARWRCVRSSCCSTSRPRRSIPSSSARVLRVMRALAEEGRTMLVVTHEMGFAREVSSRVVFLHQGVVEADGTPAELFGSGRSERFRQFVAG